MPPWETRLRSRGAVVDEDSPSAAARGPAVLPSRWTAAARRTRHGPVGCILPVRTRHARKLGEVEAHTTRDAGAEATLPPSAARGAVDRGEREKDERGKPRAMVSETTRPRIAYI